MIIMQKYLGANLELLVIFVFGASVFAVIFVTSLFVLLLHIGKRTVFPPDEPHIGYFPGPTSRGTISLIIGCLSTIYSCVYVSVHTDVPSSLRSEAFKRDFARTTSIPKVALKYFFNVWDLAAKPIPRRIVWMLYNMWAPELIVFTSMYEHRSAKDGRRYMHSLGRKEWTMTHAFFADMGGFAVEVAGQWTASDPRQLHVFTIGKEFYDWYDRAETPELDWAGITAEIQDRSKTSGLLKVFTVMQALAVVMETIMRKVEGRAVSELEVTTCAFIMCTTISYAFWYHKPYDVKSHVCLRLNTGVACQLPVEVEESNLAEGDQFQDTDALVEKGNKAIAEQERDNGIEREHSPKLPRITPFNRTFHLRDPKREWLKNGLICGVVGAAIGLIHCSLWNAQFINTTGQWMWRASSLAQTIFPLTIATVAPLELVYTGKPLYYALIAMSLLYSFARTLLWLTIGLSFWSLPPGVYNNISWSMPHWH